MILVVVQGHWGIPTELLLGIPLRLKLRQPWKMLGRVPYFRTFISVVVIYINGEIGIPTAWLEGFSRLRNEIVKGLVLASVWIDELPKPIVLVSIKFTDHKS